MQDIPPKLLKKLAHLSGDELEVKLLRYRQFLQIAEEGALQSPRFWAMRQVLSERNDEEVKRIVKRRKKNELNKSRSQGKPKLDIDSDDLGDLE